VAFGEFGGRASVPAPQKAAAPASPAAPAKPAAPAATITPERAATPTPATTAAAQEAKTPAPLPERTPETDKSATAEAPAAGKHFVAYYLHGRKRCVSCTTIERLTKNALDAHFADAQKSGLMEVRLVNVETPENRHYIQDYQITNQSVILSEVQNGKEVRWKNLKQVWRLFRDETAFDDYIRTETAAFLKGDDTGVVKR
jgi:hypothetical protein